MMERCVWLCRTVTSRTSWSSYGIKVLQTDNGNI